MSYSDQEFNSGNEFDGVSTKDATEMSEALNNISDGLVALQDDLDTVADLSATAVALTGVAEMTGTLDGALADDATNKNVKELATQVNAPIADVAAIKSALS